MKLAAKTKTAAKKAAVNGKAYVRHVPTTTSLKKSNPKGCEFPDAKSCPLVSGQAKPYRYQLGCRAEACINANSRYYKRLAKDGPKTKRKLKRKTKR